MITEIDETKCSGCGICVDHCNMDVLRLDTRQKEIPPCQANCPAGVDMRSYIYSLQQGNFEEAISFIREYLPLPAITGRVCFHPCETKCARKEVDDAVNINNLERFVADYWFKEKAKPLPRFHVAKVAIVGSGPAGLSCAYFLTKMGYPVTVFEAMAELGGLLRIGIPEYRLPRDILNAQIDYIKDMGVEFKTGITIGKDLTVESLKNSGYKALFFAMGTQLSLKLKIDGDDLDGVSWGLDFLRNTNVNHDLKINGDVLVVGGGDVAMDVALTSLRLGAKKVELACLECREEMPAHEDSLRQIADEGININVSWGPKKIVGEDGKVIGVQFVRCVSVKNKEGKFCPSFDEQITKFIKADMVVFAIGQRPDLSLLPKEISTTKDETIAADPITQETTSPSVFAGGDAVSGTSSVVEAFGSGKRAAISIDRYLKGENIKEGREEEIKTVTKSPEERIPNKVRQVATLLPVRQRSNNFKEVKIGFNKEVALCEARRCMTCGSKSYIAYKEDCMTCFECALGCGEKAISVSFSPGYVADSIDNTGRGKNIG